jgi:GT2 family glycosyltransferase/O-antigen/teichoic acid export membrane protein
VSPPPTVSIIIPSWTGRAERLLESITRQSFRDYEVHLIRAVSPAARARNNGVAAARGDLLLFVDDDAYFGHERVLEAMVETIRADPTTGVVGPSKLIPPDSTWIQRRIAAEVPRWEFPVVAEDTESNPPLGRYGFSAITTTCSLIRRDVFEQADGFDERLPTGEDTEFFYRVRALGYRFVVPRHTWVYHDPPRTLGELLKKSFRYGVGHAYEARKAPERSMDIVPLDRWYGKVFLLLSPFLFLPSLLVQLYFDPGVRVRFGLRPFKALASYASFSGYVWGWFRTPPSLPIGAPPSLPASSATPADASLSGLETVPGIVSVVIVSYNTVGLLRDCLASLHEHGGPLVGEVIVVDNASTDGSPDMVRCEFPNVQLIANQTNTGFGVANNQGVAAAKGEYVLLLNSDTRVHSSAVAALLREIRANPSVGLVGPRLLNDDGSTQPSAFRFPTPGVLLLEQAGLAWLVPSVRYDIGPTSCDGAVRSVDWLIAACVLGPRDLLRRFGPFDAAFFMYSEDVDLCYRLRAAGWEVRYAPQGVITHLGGGTTKRYAGRMLLQFVESEYLFYRKHYGPLALRLAVLIFRAMAAGKWLRDFVRLAAMAASPDGAYRTSPEREALRQSLRIWPHIFALRPPPVASEVNDRPDRPRRQPGQSANPAQPTQLSQPANPAPSALATRPTQFRQPVWTVQSAQVNRGGQVGEFPGSTTEPAPRVLASLPPTVPIALEGALPDALPGEPRPKAARGSVALIGSFLVMAVLNYGFAILMSWILPLEQFGRLGVVQSILLLGATVVNAGFPWALTRYIAQSNAGTGKPDSGVTAGAFRGALAGNVVLGAGIAILLYGVTAAGWLPLHEGYLPLMLLAGITVVVLGAFAVFSAVLQGFLRLEALGVARALEVAVKFAAGVGLVLWTSSAAGAIAGFLVGAVVATLVAAAMLRTLPVWRGRGWGSGAVYANVGPFFTGMFGLTVLVNADIIGLKFLSPPSIAEHLAGQYQAAVTLARIPVFLALALFNAVFPYVARHGSGSAEASLYARLSLKYTVLFIVPLGIVFAVIPDAMVRTFFSPAFADSAQPLAVAAIGTGILALIHGLALLLQASGRVYLTAVWLLLGVLLEIAMLVWLVPGLGMIGAALAVLAASLVVLAALSPVALRLYRIQPSVGDSAAYAGALLVAALVLWLGPLGGRLITLATIALSGIAYTIALMLLGLLTPRDVAIASGALGPRWNGQATRLAGLVGRLNLRNAGN